MRTTAAVTATMMATMAPNTNSLSSPVLIRV
jgi:hypothetical protein